MLSMTFYTILYFCGSYRIFISIRKWWHFSVSRSIRLKPDTGLSVFISATRYRVLCLWWSYRYFWSIHKVFTFFWLGSWGWCVSGAGQQVLPWSWRGGRGQHHEGHLHQELQRRHPGHHPAHAVPQQGQVVNDKLGGSSLGVHNQSTVTATNLAVARLQICLVLWVVLALWLSTPTCAKYHWELSLLRFNLSGAATWEYWTRKFENLWKQLDLKASDSNISIQ